MNDEHTLNGENAKVPFLLTTPNYRSNGHFARRQNVTAQKSIPYKNKSINSPLT